MSGSNDIHKVRRRPNFRHGELKDEKAHKSRSSRHETSVEPDVSEVRRIRLERLEGHNRTTRNSAATEKIFTESTAIVDAAKSSSHRRRKHHTSEEDAGHSRSKSGHREDKSPNDYVYAVRRDSERRSRPRGISATQRKRREEEEESSSDSEDEREDKSGHMDSKPKKKTKDVVREEPKRSSSKAKKEDKDQVYTKRSAETGTPSSKRTSHRTKTTAGDPVSRPPLSRYSL